MRRQIVGLEEACLMYFVPWGRPRICYVAWNGRTFCRYGTVINAVLACWAQKDNFSTTSSYSGDGPGFLYTSQSVKLFSVEYKKAQVLFPGKSLWKEAWLDDGALWFHWSADDKGKKCSLRRKSLYLEVHRLLTMWLALQKTVWSQVWQTSAYLSRCWLAALTFCHGPLKAWYFTKRESKYLLVIFVLYFFQQGMSGGLFVFVLFLQFDILCRNHVFSAWPTPVWCVHK